MFLQNLQPDRVTDFCKKNKLQLIIRAHECVMDGFERFAQGQLITLFSATNYCGKLRKFEVFLHPRLVAFAVLFICKCFQGRQTMLERYW